MNLPSASPQLKSSTRPTFPSGRGFALSPALLVSQPRLLRAETSLAYKYQDYQEADDRIRVRNHNARASIDLGGAETVLRVPLTFPENRPGSREKTILFTQVARHLEGAHASLEASVRFYTDSHGIDSDTLEFAWLQKLGDRVVVSPYARYYRQGQADFYHVNLDDTPIVPVAEPDGSAPNYSSDYRLSRLEATTFGLKVTYRRDERWSADLSYERYDMRGRDGITPASAYITAGILTGGIHLWF